MNCLQENIIHITLNISNEFRLRLWQTHTVLNIRNEPYQLDCTRLPLTGVQQVQIASFASS